MSYLADKRAALAAGKPWPPPREDKQPVHELPEHDWRAVSTPEDTHLWRCASCDASVLEAQRPAPGRCRWRKRTTQRGPRS